MTEVIIQPQPRRGLGAGGVMMGGGAENGGGVEKGVASIMCAQTTAKWVGRQGRFAVLKVKPKPNQWRQRWAGGMAPPPLKIAQPFMAGFTVRECSKSRQGRKILADGHHCARPPIFLSSLAGLLPLFDAIPSHEWLGYCHRIAPQLCRLRASVSWTAGASAARPRFRPHKNLSHQLYSPSARKRRHRSRSAGALQVRPTVWRFNLTVTASEMRPVGTLF